MLGPSGVRWERCVRYMTFKINTLTPEYPRPSAGPRPTPSTALQWGCPPTQGTYSVARAPNPWVKMERVAPF